MVEWIKAVALEAMKPNILEAVGSIPDKQAKYKAFPSNHGLQNCLVNYKLE